MSLTEIRLRLTTNTRPLTEAIDALGAVFQRLADAGAQLNTALSSLRPVFETIAPTRAQLRRATKRLVREVIWQRRMEKVRNRAETELS